MKVEGKVRQLVEMLLGKNSWMNIVIYAYVVIFEIKSLNYCSLLILHIHSLTVCDKYLPCFTCSSST